MSQASVDTGHHCFLTREIRSVHRHAQLVWLAAMTLGAAGIFGVLLVISLMLDHHLVLSPLARLVLLLIVMAAPMLVLRIAWRRQPGRSIHSAALLIEREFDSLDNILINSLQLAEDPQLAGNAFVNEVAQEAAQQLKSIRPRRAVRKRWLTGAVLAAIVGGGVIAIQAKSNPDQLNAGINRVFVPFGDNTFTQILQIDPGDMDVLVHSDVDVVASLGGRVPTQADLQCTMADGRAMAIRMAALSSAVPDRLAARIERIEQDMTYRVFAGDDRSQAFTIRVHERPVIKRIMQTVIPPAYVGGGAIERMGGTIQALAGSQVQLRVSASEPLKEAKLMLNDNAARAMDLIGGTAADTTGLIGMKVRQRGRYRLELTSKLGFAVEPASFDIRILRDRPPKVSFLQPKTDLAVDIDAQVVVEVQARDDHAVRELQLDRVGGKQPVRLNEWVEKKPDKQRVTRKYRINVAELGIAEDTPIVLKAAAYDFRPGSEPGVSDPITISLKTETLEDNANKTDATSPVSLGDLITLQRNNLSDTQALRGDKNADKLAAVQRQQEKIRANAISLAANEAAENPAIKQQLTNLAKTLMVVAVEQLHSGQIGEAVKTEKAILAALIGANADQNEEASRKHAREISQMLAELIGRQKTVNEDTAKKAATGQALGARQRVLSRKFASLHRLISGKAKIGAGGNDDLASQYKQMLAIFDDQKVRATMLIAAERLRDGAFEAAMRSEDKVLKALLEAQAILRKVAMEEAKEELEELKEGLKDAKERLDRLTELQQSVTEVAQQLNATKDRRDGREDEFDHAAELDEVREDVDDAIEELIKDMHLFPPSDISNDLLSEMGEIFEDVKQAEGSEEKAVQEIAVERDEGLLAKLKEMQKKMEERLGDVEMWLPDEPDTIRWKQESFDKNEMGEIPLGDLPDELEDIVGDLTEQAENLTEEAQDSASNVGLPDMVMGWDIVDGPMPSWAAKGKSGNQKPNTNEQIGRSGSGRQGMSSGEVVGDTLKALEGSDVKTRRTEDPFQAGELMEEDPSFMDVKATGGGKLAGITNKEGMIGNAPARDVLKYRQLQRSSQMLKRNAQSIYTKAKMLRLPTGEMDRALLEMDAAQRRLDAGDMAGFIRSQHEVVRALKQTHGRLTGKMVIEDRSSPTSTAAVAGAANEPIPRQYEDVVADYMRHIAEGP